MIHAIWPTVSIRPANVTVNPNVASANAGDYVDWVDACQPINIPIEGQGDRVELQLQASIDPLYTDIQYASMSDWQYLLPAEPGVHYWNDASGGTPLTAVDEAGDVVSDPYPSTGQYTRTVYELVDPNGSLAAEAANDSPTVVQSVCEESGPNGALVRKHILAKFRGTRDQCSLPISLERLT